MQSDRELRVVKVRHELQHFFVSIDRVGAAAQRDAVFLFDGGGVRGIQTFGRAEKIERVNVARVLFEFRLGQRLGLADPFAKLRGLRRV